MSPATEAPRIRQYDSPFGALSSPPPAVVGAGVARNSFLADVGCTGREGSRVSDDAERNRK